MTKGEPALLAENLCVEIGGRLVLHDVSISLKPGTISVILGPNGAGKSTLLSCLAGLRLPSGGSAKLGGANLAAMKGHARARRIGLLPQNGNVHWDLPVRDLIALGRYPFAGISSKAQDEAIIDAAMAATATTDFAERNVLSLSGGERARVLFARVLAGGPRWLLADEPLANLDPRFQLQLMAQMRTLADAGTGVVAVLHDLTQAAQIADHILLLRAGRLFAAGPPQQVLTAENIEAVYDIAVTILNDPLGRMIILPQR